MKTREDKRNEEGNYAFACRNSKWTGTRLPESKTKNTPTVNQSAPQNMTYKNKTKIRNTKKTGYQTYALSRRNHPKAPLLSLPWGIRYRHDLVSYVHTTSTSLSITSYRLRSSSLVFGNQENQQHFLRSFRSQPSACVCSWVPACSTVTAGEKPGEKSQLRRSRPTRKLPRASAPAK